MSIMKGGHLLRSGVIQEEKELSEHCNMTSYFEKSNQTEHI